MDSFQMTIIGICVVLLSWYAIGVAYNRRRAAQVLRWLRAGLSRVGKEETLRWHSRLHNAARLDVGMPKTPFRQMQVIFVLEPRENPLVWIPRRLRGRGDELVVRADLRALPQQELEAAPHGHRSLAGCLASQEEPYTLLPEGGRFDVAWRGPASPAAAERLRLFLEKYPRARWRVSLQRKPMHLTLHASLDELRRTPAEEFFKGLMESLR